MKHRLFTILAALSLLLCAAVVVLWVRSASGYERLRACPRQNHYLSVFSSRGSIGFSYLMTIYPYESEALTYDRLPMDDLPAIFGDFNWTRFDAGKTHYIYEVEHTNYYLELPHWAVLLATLALPLIWIARRTRHVDRQNRCLCPACGYDLRATPDRCPECGTASAKAPT